jgi:hypothetical protein
MSQVIDQCGPNLEREISKSGKPSCGWFNYSNLRSQCPGEGEFTAIRSSKS